MRIDESSGRYDAEIALAERAVFLIEERLEHGRLPDDSKPKGDVHELIDAVGELLHLEGLEYRGRPVSQKRVVKAVERLRSAVDRVALWPSVPRTLVIAPLGEALEEFEVEWIAIELFSALPDFETMNEQEREATLGAVRRIVPAQIRIVIATGDWEPEFEALLRLLREMALADPGDAKVEDALRRGIVFHALRGRDALLAEERRGLAATEPLPKDLEDALAELADEEIASDLVMLSLHLLLVDLGGADLVPDRASPRQVVAAVFAALVEHDDPEERPDARRLASWAKISLRRLAALSRQVDPVFDWVPPGFDGPIEVRQEKRWRYGSLTMEFMPPRWVPPADSTLPPYSEVAARERAAELRDIAWLMIDPMEPVRFVAEAFHYGDGAPDEIDTDLALELVDLWKQEKVIDTMTLEDEIESDEDWDDDGDWEDDASEGEAGFPTLVTTDGEPLVFCTAEYEIAGGEDREIVRRLDAMRDVRREQEDGRERWVWMEPRADGNVVIASLSLEADRLKVETQSVLRSARVGGRLAEEIGDRITLVDHTTQKVTPEMLASRAAGPRDGEDRPSIPPDEERRMVREVMEQHYRRWPDEPVPALEGLTPREAVADPDLRGDVIALLREFEEQSRSGPEAMRGFDFGFLWEQLGLDRQGNH
jgi:hypothetical protein